MWPEKVSIDDGFARGVDGYFFPRLTEINDQIEAAADSSDDWLTIITWSMFQAFHAASKQLVSEGDTVLYTRKVSKSEIQKRVSSHLNQPEWEDINSEYVDDLQAT